MESVRCKPGISAWNSRFRCWNSEHGQKTDNPAIHPNAPQHAASSCSKHQSLVRADAPLDHLAAVTQDVDLAFPLVHVDANMVHGWPLPFCGVDRGVFLWGSICHHVKREASRFIPSTL